jgi:predicted Zn-dependent protease
MLLFISYFLLFFPIFTILKQDFRFMIINTKNMRNCTFKLVTLFIFFLFSFQNFIQGQNSAKDDQLLQTLVEECDRNFAVLKNQDPPVYLLSYRLEDQTIHNINSNLGSIESSKFEQNRIITIQVRIGSKTMDNFREMRNQSFSFYVYDDEIMIPIDNNYLAVKQTLWRETEKVYRAALLKYEQVKANAAVTTELDDKSPDYSDSQYESYYEPSLTNTQFDADLWKAKLSSYTLPFLQYHNILSGRSFIRFSVIRKLFVSSDGVAIAQNNTYSHLFISIEGKADDGMEIPLYKSWFGFYPDELPDNQTVLTEVETLKTLFERLRTAPIVDTYSGPAILSNDAAGVFFHEIFGHRVEGARMKSENDGQTFKKKVGEQVLNPDISITFDPTIRFYKGIPLNGSYVFDDEGIRGSKVVVVENGILKNFLMTRTPIEGFDYSNGHARAQAGYQPVSRQSNLIVETQHPYSDTELRNMLIMEAKNQGKEYGYFFKKVTGGFTTTGRYMPNSFNVTPIEVYRVYVDGRPDELVRGVDLIGTPLAMFSQIGAIGTVPGNFAGTCGAESGGIPAGCCSPAVFVKRIELQKQNKSQEKLPIIQRPSDVQSLDNKQEMIFKAMEDEMLRNRGGLFLSGLKSPHFYSYTLADANFISINCYLGGIIYSNEKSINSQKTKVLVGSNKFNNLNFFDENSLYSGQSEIPLSQELDYTNIRNSFWISSDSKFKNAAEIIETKSVSIAQQNLPQELLNLHDYYPVDVKTNFLPNETPLFTKSLLENIGIQISKIFNQYPNFTNSGVRINAVNADIYYISSEKMKFKQPYNLLTIRIFAQTQAIDGEPLMDYIDLYFTSPNEIPSVIELTQKTKLMTDRLEQLRTAPVIDEAYSGPVMFIDDAVAEMFTNAFVKDNNGILAGRRFISSTSEISQWMTEYVPKENKSERLIHKKVISRNLNLMTTDYLKSYNNTSLIGHFTLDADGVNPDNYLKLIENGVLLSVLTNRIPTFSSESSNGHERFGFSSNKISSDLAPGVLMFTSENDKKFTLSYEKMKKKLIELAKEEDFDYAYIVVKIPDRSVKVPGIGDYFASNGFVRPMFVYRVNVKDGSETLVRTTKMSLLKMKLYKQVEAVSKELIPFNRMFSGKQSQFYGYNESALSGIPMSYILPKAMIFKELEIEKDDEIMRMKEPLVPNPMKQP